MVPGWNFKLMWFSVIQRSDCVLLLPQILSQICLSLLRVTTIFLFQFPVVQEELTQAVAPTKSRSHWHHYFVQGNYILFHQFTLFLLWEDSLTSYYWHSFLLLTSLKCRQWCLSFKKTRPQLIPGSMELRDYVLNQ